ncbi:MAG: VUT family protein, partial [Rhodococcus sp. (in: high G+C Gram-positive bacteria)]
MTASDQQTKPDDHATFAHVSRGYYPTFVALFTATLLISNICATKGVAFFADSSLTIGPLQILPVITDGGFFLFPLAYILGDVLSEVYGFKSTRRAIYLGFGALILAAFCFWLLIELPSADFYENQEALRSVVGVYPRLLLAGLAGYLVGQMLNSV